MRAAEHFDEFGGRQVLRLIVWIGLCGISGLLWGMVGLIGLVLYGFAVELMAP